MMQLDMFSGRANRDEGMAATQLVEERLGDWMHNAKRIILRDFPRGWEGLAEEFRPAIEDEIGPPHTGNVWGALTHSCIKAGIFRRTDTLKQCSRRSNHARLGAILKRT
jgi:hypothetical protein